MMYITDLINTDGVTMAITVIILPGASMDGITAFMIPGITAGTAPGTIPGVGIPIIMIITLPTITLHTQSGAILQILKHPENRLTLVRL